MITRKEWSFDARLSIFNEALNTGLQPSRRRNWKCFTTMYLQNTAPYKQLCWNLSIKLVRLDWISGRNARPTSYLPLGSWKSTISAENRSRETEATV